MVVGLVASMTELRIGLGSLVLVSAGLSLAATRVPSAQPYREAAWDKVMVVNPRYVGSARDPFDRAPESPLDL